MAGSGFSGIPAALTPTGWVRKESTILNWQSRRLLHSPPLRTLIQRTMRVIIHSADTQFDHNYTPSLNFTPSDAFVSEGELIEKSSHPTAMMLTSTINLLKTLSLSAGIHAEVLQTDATRTLCGLLRMLVESGANDKSGS